MGGGPVIVLVLSFVLAAGSAGAHGVNETPSPQSETTTTRTGSSWLQVWPSAIAALRTRIEEQDGFRVFEADGLPDHSTGSFPNRGNPNRIQNQNYRLRVPLQPQKGAQITQLPRGPFGIALNGVMFDPATAEFWRNDPRSGWNYDALSGHIDLGIDRNNAHVQPTGAYHYHGIPAGLLERVARLGQPALLGYAADGFPIYGPKGYRAATDAASPLVDLRPGWRLRQGTRPSGPGGAYTGTYVEDFEYVAGHGDLDSCNGRDGVTPEYPNGTYHYVVTAAFPFVPRCFTGTPHASFRQGPPHTRGGPPGGGPGAGPPGGPPGGGPPPERYPPPGRF
jgi:hypothetical protein